MQACCLLSVFSLASSTPRKGCDARTQFKLKNKIEEKPFLIEVIKSTIL
jgi:hypothetical protein